MKSLRLGYIALFVLAACAQERLEVDKDQVFSREFPLNKLALTHDDGRAVSIRAVRPSGGSGGHGFISQDYFGGCQSIFGCDQNPYSYFTGYSNYVHAWNPGASRTVNLNFGNRNGFDPFASSTGRYCVNLQVTSNRQLQVLQFSANQNPNNNFVTGSGSNTLNIQGRTNFVGQVIFAVVDQQALTQYCPNYYQPGWNPSQWWQWQWNWQQPSYPECNNVPQQQATLRITGTAGPCSAPQQISEGGDILGIDLTSRINVQSGQDPYNWFWGQNQQMPYFRDTTGGVWGRVLQYSTGVGANFWGL